MRSITVLAAVSALWLSALPASAKIYTYRLTGDFDATFTIDDASALNFPGDGDTGFLWPMVSGVFGGYALTHVLIGFPTTEWGGGIEASSAAPDPSAESLFGRDNFFSGAGETLFTGTIFAPKLKTGSFDLTDFYEPSKSYHLEVSAAPEPAAWALMISGFGMAGAMLRRARRLA